MNERHINMESQKHNQRGMLIRITKTYERHVNIKSLKQDLRDVLIMDRKNMTEIHVNTKSQKHTTEKAC